MRKSPFSLSSMNAFIASMDLLRGHLSILALNLMLAICRLRLSLSMLLLVELLELELRLLEKASGPGLSTGRLLVAVGLTCQARRPPTGFLLTFLKLSGGGELVAGPYLS